MLAERLADFDPDSRLRDELSDAEYDSYLNATGRPSRVTVTGVMENSQAEYAGIRPGDQIVTYAGVRVFDFREVVSLTQQGTPGESVIVELLRDGQPMQVAVYRGVLGASLR